MQNSGEIKYIMVLMLTLRETVEIFPVEISFSFVSHYVEVAKQVITHHFRPLRYY